MQGITCYRVNSRVYTNRSGRCPQAVCLSLFIAGQRDSPSYTRHPLLCVVSVHLVRDARISFMCTTKDTCDRLASTLSNEASASKTLSSFRLLSTDFVRYTRLDRWAAVFYCSEFSLILHVNRPHSFAFTQFLFGKMSAKRVTAFSIRFRTF